MPSLVTGSSFMSIPSLVLEYKGLTGNPKIGNTHIWALPNIWRLRKVKDTKFRRNVGYKRLLDAAKSQGYSFYLF